MKDVFYGILLLIALFVPTALVIWFIAHNWLLIVVIAVTLLSTGGLAVAAFTHFEKGGYWQKPCEHGNEKLHQIEYGGGYISECMHCGQQRHMTR